MLEATLGIRQHAKRVERAFSLFGQQFDVVREVEFAVPVYAKPFDIVLYEDRLYRMYREGGSSSKAPSTSRALPENPNPGSNRTGLLFPL